MDNLRVRILGLLVAGVLVVGCVPNRTQLSASEIYVIDGDTIDISGERVRLIGFDTPETYRAKCSFEKNLGDNASVRLAELVAGSSVLEISYKPRRDNYGRLLGNLYVNGKDVGSVLVSEGLARAYNGGKRSEWC